VEPRSAPTVIFGLGHAPCETESGEWISPREELSKSSLGSGKGLQHFDVAVLLLLTLSLCFEIAEAIVCICLKEFLLEGRQHVALHMSPSGRQIVENPLFHVSSLQRIEAHIGLP
jgi:hypothetical protein